MDSIEHLTVLFQKFPGVGPRQATRFVYYLLRSSPTLRREFIDSVRGLSTAAKQCPQCFRYHSHKESVCSVCKDTNRNVSLLMVIASDADLSSLEHSGTYKGRYFVLGGTVILGADKNHSLRTKELTDSLPAHITKGLKEVILAFPANPEGDATALHLRDTIVDLPCPSLKITSLGRGLSTGSELEYADSDTLRNALANRR